MTVFHRHARKKIVIIVAAVLLIAAIVFAVYKIVPHLFGTSGTAHSATKDTGLYLDKGDLWQWINGRRTQLTRIGTITTFDWHPAGGEVVYATHETGGSYKIVHRNLASKQELVIYQGKTSMGPKLLCTQKGVEIVEAAALTTPQRLQLTVTSVGYDGTMNGSFWTQVPITQEQFDRTTFLDLADTTPLIVSPGGIWAIGSSTLNFDTTHTFLSTTGVSFSDGTFFGPMQDTKGTFLGLRTKNGKVTSVAAPSTGTGIIPPFVRGASRSTDGTTIVYELGIYSTGTGSKAASLAYETWQYTMGGRKARLVTKGSSPSLFAFQFTGEAVPVAIGKQPGATVTTTTGLMFRDHPVTVGSNVLEVAAPSEKRTALALGQGWVEAKGLGQAKGKNGWIYGGYTAVTRGSVSYAPFACVTASKAVKVYLEENLSGTPVTTLDPGDSVVAIGVSTDKRTISVMLPSGTTGFVQAAGVTISN